MTPLVEATGLVTGYAGRQVLAGVDLAVRPGELLAVVGPNGSGKTTLLRALARVLEPFAGCVRIDGNDPWRHGSRWTARRLVAAVAAPAAIWPLTVADAVALGRAPHRGWFLPYTAADRNAIQQAIARTGLGGLETRLLHELSAGESQRVVFARALAQSPQILLLDEPTAHLDLRFQMEIMSLTHDLAKNDRLAVVAAVHDLTQAARWADRVAMMSAGRVVALGTPVEVLTPETLAAVYGIRAAVIPHPATGTPLVVPLASLAAESAP